MPAEIGSTLVWTVYTRDAAGALTDATSPALSVVLPDGTVKTSTAHPTVVAITKTATGTYRATCVSSLAGRYRATASGTGVANLPFTDVADVVPADPRLIIGLAAARAALDIPAGVRTDDDEIRALVLTATAMIEDVVGPVLSRSVEWTVSGAGRAAILLPEYPSAVAVAEDGVELVEGVGFCWDEFGALWRGTCPGAGRWSATRPRNVAITATVGATSVAPNILTAAARLVAHLFNLSQRPRMVLGPDGMEDVSPTPSGYAMPNSVMDMLRPSMAGRVPGLA